MDRETCAYARHVLMTWSALRWSIRQANTTHTVFALHDAGPYCNCFARVRTRLTYTHSLQLADGHRHMYVRWSNTVCVGAQGRLQQDKVYVPSCVCVCVELLSLALR